MRRPMLAALALLAAVLAMPAIAWAQPQLVSSTPAANATVAKPTRLTLTFSETPVASQSGMDLTMTAMPGMSNHQPMPVRGFAVAVEGKSLVANLPRALPTGTYSLSWHAAAADGQQVEGRFTFEVR